MFGLVFDKLIIFPLFPFRSKFWTRNRPGDRMRDKYNLNLLPKDFEEAAEYDEEHLLASNNGGEGGAEGEEEIVLAHIPGLGFDRPEDEMGGGGGGEASAGGGDRNAHNHGRGGGNKVCFGILFGVYSVWTVMIILFSSDSSGTTYRRSSTSRSGTVVVVVGIESSTTPPPPLSSSSSNRSTATATVIPIIIRIDFMGHRFRRRLPHHHRLHHQHLPSLSSLRLQIFSHLRIFSRPLCPTMICTVQEDLEDREAREDRCRLCRPFRRPSSAMAVITPSITPTSRCLLSTMAVVMVITTITPLLLLLITTLRCIHLILHLHHNSCILLITITPTLTRTCHRLLNYHLLLIGRQFRPIHSFIHLFISLIPTTVQRKETMHCALSAAALWNYCCYHYYYYW